jgi:hypothetical protein
MDYGLIALIGMTVATVLVGIKLKLWWWPARPGYEYQRVFQRRCGRTALSRRRAARGFLGPTSAVTPDTKVAGAPITRVDTRRRAFGYA